MVRRIVVAVLLLSGTAVPSTVQADEVVVREVLAGARAPGGATGPFVHTAFYPDTVEAKRGDVVRWTFPGSYGWHTVSFGSLPERVFRDDEYPGHVAFDEPWLFGHELGDESKACGRGSYWNEPDQPACVLDEEAIGGQLSSSLFDRFFSIPDPDSTFSAVVDLEPGSYPFFCKIHPDMVGELKVVPDSEEVSNPTPEEIDAAILADQAEAERLRARLNDVDSAWDPAAEEWVVQVGGSTGRVDIHEFMPVSLPVDAGEHVRFEGGTHDPSSVAFPADAQGGFYALGSCDAQVCAPGPVNTSGVPWGMTGWAFPWACDVDDRSGGLPGVPFSYVPARVAERTQPAGVRRGCPVGALPEMLLSAYMGRPNRSPGDVVVPGAVHMSGWMSPEDTPDWFAKLPDGSRVLHRFDAEFPVAGTYAFACLNHEFMRGTIVVG
ncbi:MAG TPA: hypothetical protein VM840_13140 [Actinomycetota bacterium]|nr:hypothetical protein [Actinomycetota bacterium]